MVCWSLEDCWCCCWWCCRIWRAQIPSSHLLLIFTLSFHSFIHSIRTSIRLVIPSENGVIVYKCGLVVCLCVVSRSIIWFATRAPTTNFVCFALFPHRPSLNHQPLYGAYFRVAMLEETNPRFCSMSGRCFPDNLTGTLESKNETKKFFEHMVISWRKNKWRMFRKLTRK